MEPDLIDLLKGQGPLTIFAVFVALLYRKEIGAFLMAPRGDAMASAMLTKMTEQFGQNLHHFQAVEAHTERAADACEALLEIAREQRADRRLADAVEAAAQRKKGQHP